MTRNEFKPLVSIGLPVYNNEQTLQRSLNSLFSQDYEKIELIASDDKSIDKSATILEKYADKEPRLKVKNNKQNIGAYHNFLKVLELSKGKYFIWASGDDYWDRSFVSTLIREIEKNGDSVACMCAYKSVRSDGTHEIHKFTGNRYPEKYSALELAMSLLTKRDKHGNVVKNNMYIHGLLNREKFIKALKAFPGIFTNERQILCQMALAGDFAYVDNVLFEKTVDSKPFKIRNPNDPLSVRNAKYNSYDYLISTPRSLIISKIIPAKNKIKIPVLVGLYYLFYFMPRVYSLLFLLSAEQIIDRAKKTLQKYLY